MLVDTICFGLQTTVQFTDFLNANPAIRSLRLINVVFRNTLGQSESRITLPSLQNLELDLNTDLLNWLLEKLALASQDFSLKLRGRGAFNENSSFRRALQQLSRQTQIISLDVVGQIWPMISGLLSYLSHLRTLRVRYPGRSNFDLNKIRGGAGLLTSLHNVEIAGSNTEDVQPILWILALPTVKHILFADLRSMDGGAMNVHQVIKWMRGLEVTANISESYRLKLLSHPSPFM